MTEQEREEAAAEITRLREENERLTKERDDFHMQYRAVCDEEVKIYVVEIERLREALKQIHDAVDFPEDTLRRKIRAARAAMGESDE